MAWLRVESSFPNHRKIMMAGHLLGTGSMGRIIGLWSVGACYSVANLTDGFVPRIVFLDARYDKKPSAVVDVMVQAGLLEAAEGGYLLHDFTQYNPSAAEVKAKMDWDARRKQLYAMPNLVAEIRRRDKDRCRYCGRAVNWKDRRGEHGGTYDHVIPRGANSLQNVVVCCFHCNGRKGGRTPEQAGMTLLAIGQVGTSSELDTSSQNHVDYDRFVSRTRARSDSDSDSDSESESEPETKPESKKIKPSRASRSALVVATDPQFDVVTSDSQFDLFWHDYPRKTGKGAAWKAWASLKPTDQIVTAIVKALEWQRHQPSWLKDGGQFIPHPATWLNGRRWEDEPFHAERKETTAEQMARVMAGGGKFL